MKKIIVISLCLILFGCKEILPSSNTDNNAPPLISEIGRYQIIEKGGFIFKLDTKDGFVSRLIVQTDDNGALWSVHWSQIPSYLWGQDSKNIELLEAHNAKLKEGRSKNK